MIEAHELTRRYGDTTAAHSLSFTIALGTGTGFLGPNGAGKSTTSRVSEVIEMTGLAGVDDGSGPDHCRSPTAWWTSGRFECLIRPLRGLSSPPRAGSRVLASITWTRTGAPRDGSWCWCCRR